MNERIEELAEQARLWAEVSYEKQNDQFTSHWDTPIGYTVSQFFEQKFAELIVRECADLFDKNKTEYAIPEHRIHNSIMIHFGLY
jgi:hypothetical protein